MKLKSFILALSLGLATVPLSAQDILIQAGNTDLALRVGPNKRLYQIWFGEALADKSDYSKLSWNVYSGSDGSAAIRGWEVSACAGGDDLNVFLLLANNLQSVGQAGQSDDGRRNSSGNHGNRSPQCDTDRR